jgi:phage tail tape-measure protein
VLFAFSRSVQDPGDPHAKSVDERDALAGQRPDEVIARLGRAPLGGAARGVRGDARGHRRVRRVGGGHVADGPAAGQGETLGMSALARARPADDEGQGHS